MNALVIYTSQTGFTERYANWLAERLECKALDLSEANTKDAAFFDSFDALIYGGWAMAGKIHKSDWFIQRIKDWKGKKLALFMVGASPDTSPDVKTALDNALNEEAKQYAKVFYCQGGLDYEKMGFFSKIAMKLFAAFVKKKDPTTGEMISKSYDISDQKYLDPIIGYLK